jgi:adenylate kinase family enzyme
VAREIAMAGGLPVIHLDRFYWHPGWVETPKAEWAQVVSDLIAGEEWVIDGNYGGTMSLRLAAADTVVFLDVSRVVCLFRVLKREVWHRKAHREDIAPGCPGRITWEFVRWIWTYPAARRPGVLSLLSDFERGGGRSVVLRSNVEIGEFLSSVRVSDSGPRR